MTQRRHVLFVAGPAPLGGSNRSLVTLLEGLEGHVTRVLVAPGHGGFVSTVRDRGAADAYVDLPRLRRSEGSLVTPMRRAVRVLASARVALTAVRYRRQLLTIHANATTGLNLALPAALLTRTPVTVWVHDPVGSEWGRRLGPVWRRLLPEVTWAAVSDTATQVAVDNGLCRASDVEIVPNPIDPADVVAPERRDNARVTVGYLSPPTWRKGFDLLPDIVGPLADLPIEWKLFTNRNPSDFNAPVWDRLDRMPHVTQTQSHSDVRRVYAQCDIVLVPSRQESFSRITAEAMLNGIPVVATDLQPIHDMLRTGAGTVFPVGDAAAAAAAVRRFAVDPALRRTAGEEGARRAQRFSPASVTRQMLRLYGVPAT
ncbi:glycosyltransferase family 4 protein [Nocardioides sp. GXQ0305]|uniref:glycosyltransferase family 4 protein n=1 Tax=Nocardioides sp. GXQ0305 TaxID=3423912 RepID=UPI003D7C445E